MSGVLLNGEPPSNGNRKWRLLELKARSKKKKRRKDLEQLRRNVLAAKRNIKRRSVQHRRIISNDVSKNALKKTLNMFADIRQETESKTQGIMAMNSNVFKRKTICARLLPKPVIGIFKNGATGKEIQRKSTTNFPFQGTNDARLHSNIFQLLNGDDKNSQSSYTALNNYDSRNLKQNEKHEGIYKVCTIPHHIERTFDANKNSALLNNVINPKGISNGLRMENDGIEYCMTNTNTLEIVQRAHKLKRITPSSHKENDSLVKKKLTSAINNSMQSIKRWGVCPIVCYDEFCSKISEEQFFFSFTNSTVSDPIIRIRTNLAALYAETHEQVTNTSTNNKISSMSSDLVVTKISFSNQNSVIGIDHTDMTRLSSSNSPFIKSSPQIHLIEKKNNKYDDILHKHNTNKTWLQLNETSSNFLQNRERPSDNQAILMNLEKTHYKTNELAKDFGRERNILQEYLGYQFEKSPNYRSIIKPSRSTKCVTINEYNNELIQNKAKQKYIPTILRRVNTQCEISSDINLNEHHEINVLENSQVMEKKIKKPKKVNSDFTNKNTNCCLTPNTAINEFIDPAINKIHAENKEAQIYDFSMPKDEFVTQRRRNKDNYLAPVTATKHQLNKQKETHIRTQDDNIYNSSWNFNPPLLQNIENTTLSLHQTNFDNIFTQHNYCDAYSRNTKTQKYSLTPNQSSSIPDPISTHSSNYVPTTNTNFESLADKYYSKPHCGKNVRAPSVDLLQKSHLPCCRKSSSDCKMDAAIKLISLNNQDTLPSCVRYPDTNVDVNEKVLHYLKSLSFNEDNNRVSSLDNYSRHCIGNEQRILEPYSNLDQPSKYYAASREYDNHVPQRVPIYLNPEETQVMSKIENEKPTYRMNPLRQNRNIFIDSGGGVNIAIEPNTSMVNPTVNFNKSLNSKTACAAYEILLDDGRIGLFVPRNFCSISHLKDRCLNRYNSNNKLTLPHNITYH